MATSGTYLYMVRCNFKGDPAEEEQWNEWYSGPKTEMMLSFPHFLSGQRFRAVDPDEVRYLALWRVEGPWAFETAEYRRHWGFDKWTERIGDWNRVLYACAGPHDLADGVPTGARLHVTAFDGALEADGPPSTSPGEAWLTAVGLDEAWPIVRLEVAAVGAVAADAAAPAQLRAAWSTEFEPVSPLALAH